MGFPVHPRALHRHMGHPMSHKPVVKDQQIRRHGREGLDLFVNRILLPDLNTGHHGLLVNIQSATPFVHQFHRRLPFSLSPGDALRLKSLHGVLPDSQGQQFGVPWDVQVQISYGLFGTKLTPAFFHGDNC